MVIRPKRPPITLEIATSTVPTALPPVPVGALCTASSSVTRCVISRWLIRNDWKRLNSVGSFVHRAEPCAMSGGSTSRPMNTTTATRTA